MATYLSQLKLPTTFIPQRALTVAEAESDLVLLANGLDTLAAQISGGGTSVPLAGLNVALTGNVIATDTILSAFGKLEHRVNINDAKVSYPGLPTFAQVLSKPTTLTGYGIVANSSDYSSFYLGITDTAADSNKLGGVISTSYALQSWVTSQLSSYLLSSTAASTYLTVGNFSSLVSLTTSGITEGSNLYFTSSRTLATSLSGLSTATNALVTTADTILSGIGKLQAQISTITASGGAITSVNGLTGSVVLTTSNISESGNLYFTAARTLATPITGFSSTSGAISTSDSILVALGKLQYQISNSSSGVSSVNGLTGSITLTTSLIPEGSNQYHTAARTLGTILSGLSVSTATAITASDSILVGMGKLQGQISAISGVSSGVSSVNGLTGTVVLTTTSIAEGSNQYHTSSRTLGTVLSGLSTAVKTSVLSTDTILAGIGKLQGQVSSLVTGVSSVNSLTGAVVLTTSAISEGTNQYFTSTRVLSTLLSGLSTASGGSISATDSVLSALGKLEKRMAINDAKVSYSVPSFASITSKPTTVAGYGITDAISTSTQIGTLSLTNSAVISSDTLISAVNKLQGQINSILSTLTPSVLNVALAPSTSSMYTGATLSVTATVSVTGNAGTGVTWYVDNIAGGNSTVGTITGTGNTITYTAPSTAGNHTIKAVSTVDTSKNGTSAITVSIANTVTSVVVSPSTTSLSINTSTSITATVNITGTVSQTVNWTTSGGTLTGTGNTITYTAPGTAGTYTVTATSTANTSKSATCTVTVSASSGSITVSLTPSSPTAVGSGGTIQFSSTVTGSGNTSVTWSVDGISGGNSTVGTINSSGLYTCPTVTTATIRTIKAISVADSSKSSSLRILTVISNTTTNVSPSGSTTGNTDTTNINSALSSAGNGIVKLAAGNYYINPRLVNSNYGIFLNNGNTLLMSPGTILNCQTQSVSSGYSVVACTTANCNVVGGTILGDRIARNLPTYINGVGSDLEVGQGITIANGSNFRILGVSTNNNVCDGIYITNSAANWIISDHVSDNNRRQGISPVSGSNGIIQYSTFSNTNGNDPAFGIDFEPNSGTSITNVLVDHCTITGNVGGGIAGGPSVANGISGNNSAICNNITVQNCTITGNGGNNYHGGGIHWTESSYITIQNNVISNNLDTGLAANYMALNFLIDGNTVQSNNGYGIEVGDGFGTAGEAAGTVISNNIVRLNSATQIYSYPGCGATLSNNTTT